MPATRPCLPHRRPIPRPAPHPTRWAALALCSGVLVAACSTAPKHPGFYRDDGPPEVAPKDLSQVPDAVPRDEALNPFANRPYVALGRNYVPDTTGAPFRQRGIASWYGRQFQGNRTSSGEPYDMFAMTAAHPTLPIPSYARVTSVKDGRAVIVRINDRGPFYKDRIIDLSYAAAVRLGIAATGSGEVEVERVVATSGAPLVASAAAARAAPAAAPAPVPAPAPAAPEGGRSVDLAALAPAASALPVAPAAAAPAETHALPPAADPVVAIASASLTPDPSAAAPQWSVQLGAFAVAANADALKERLSLLLSAPEAATLPEALRVPSVVRGGSLLRVLVGSSPDRALAMQWARQLERFLARPTTLYLH